MCNTPHDQQYQHNLTEMQANMISDYLSARCIKHKVHKYDVGHNGTGYGVGYPIGGTAVTVTHTDTPSKLYQSGVTVNWIRPNRLYELLPTHFTSIGAVCTKLLNICLGHYLEGTPFSIEVIIEGRIDKQRHDRFAKVYLFNNSTMTSRFIQSTSNKAIYNNPGSTAYSLLTHLTSYYKELNNVR